jgi:hypothetical protein
VGWARGGIPPNWPRAERVEGHEAVGEQLALRPRGASSLPPDGSPRRRRAERGAAADGAPKLCVSASTPRARLRRR